ncbi:MAG: S41 family peptidase [Bacteroidales bacterium]|nr:S41 family peptidase [Bacteroidales bacterium]
MKAMIKKYILFLSGLFALVSCEKALVEPDPANEPKKNFDILWETFDKKYTFFELKNIDWDSVYHVYEPNVKPGMSRYELFDVMDNMLYTLEDGHVNLVSRFDVSRNWNWRLDYPSNFDYDLVERHYLGNDYERTGPFQNKVIDSIGYVYYGSFANSVSNFNINYLVAKFWHTKGIIFDIRDNGGGYTSNVERIVSRFADKKRLVSLTYYKNGPVHNDFTDPVEEHIEPAGQRQYTKPVVVLTNRSCYSAANDFVLAMDAFPNVMIIGDKTGGGGGIPIDYELPNGWRFRFSATKTTTPDGFNVEEGIPPDIEQNLLQEDEQQNIDSIIERAMEYINQQYK